MYKIELSNETIVSIPKETIIINTEPSAFIETLNYTKIIFNDENNLKITYNFPDKVINEPGNNKKQISFLPIILGIGSIISFYVIIKLKKKSNKENITKTFSKNERLIVKALMENKGEIKRNLLERKTKMAKSSLANTLNMLERKKIIEINKTHTTHYIKFTRWFNDL